jgi:ABC-type multidrug transport system ATPase subunit
MDNLKVENIGKHYLSQWLFRNISFSLNTGESIAITGHNGSGKSTLLQIVYGLVQQSEGSVFFNERSIEKPEFVFSMTTPSLELPMDFSMNDILKLYQSLNKISIESEAFGLQSMFSNKQMKQPLKNFSSGMLQRFKTALCLYSDSPVLLLDEPLTNMDSNGEKWYQNCVNEIKKNKIILFAGNQKNEIELATNLIEIV